MSDPHSASHQPPPPARPFLEMRAISKAFLGVPALKDVDFDLVPGEVHALMGENGAGKSTLMKILAGALTPDHGEILLDGEPIHLHSPRQAQHLGISIIHQEFNLLPERSVAQNIYLGREPRSGITVDTRTMEQDTAALLETIGASQAIVPNRLVGRLSVAQQQIVEIAKALSFDARIVVMDEPTASLAPTEVAALFTLVRSLQDRGIAFVYISHRLEELQKIAQRITVLKDGRLVTTVNIADATPAQLVSAMVGRELASYYPPLAPVTGDIQPVLDVRNAGNAVLHDISLTINAGEITALAGLEGSGRTELARAIFGADPFTTGSVSLDGLNARFTHPRQAIRAGIGFLTEDRKSEGLILVQSIRDNALLTLRSLLGRARRGARISDSAQQVDLRAASLAQEVQYLSGGNQQKVVLMKWLQVNARLIIFDEPTRGIDIGAKAGIHELMRDLAINGAAILMISSELPEVIGMADRILIMRQGTIAGELPPGSTEASIMTIASGQQARTLAA